jgi:hypothetical protein
VGTVFRQNIENASAAIGTDNLLVNGVPPWMATSMSGLLSAGSWLAAQMFGPFGFGFVAAAILFSLPDVPAIREWQRRRRERSVPRPPIEIRFDPSNPGGRFWSAERWWFPNRTYADGMEYRFEIHNNTDVALRGAFVTVNDGSGLPKRALFVRNGRDTYDIGPGHSEFIKGFLAAEGPTPQSEVTLVAGADNIMPVERRFQLDQAREPALTAL